VALWGIASLIYYCFTASCFGQKNSWLKVDGGKGFAQPNFSQGGYTYTMAKPVCQLLDFPFLCTSEHTVRAVLKRQGSLEKAD
jgi:hypothetical protein